MKTNRDAERGCGKGGFRLSVIEPSKVRNQHITLLAGIVEAGAALPDARRGSLIVHTSLLRELPPQAVSGWADATIPVMDPERRRLVRKSLLEAVIVCQRIALLRRDELLLVTCILPPALIMVELFKRLFPKTRVVVMLHGEIEGVFEADRQHRGSFGYYVKKWLGLRRRNSTLQLAVIDDFIADEIVGTFGNSIRREDVFVIPHPITAPTAIVATIDVRLPDLELLPRACFIGFKTRYKGYPIFERLAAAVPDVMFEAIGGGRAEVVSGEAVLARAGRDLVGTADYMAAIAACDVAVFPYVGGYRASLSAAALDAISVGVHLIASRRGCFVSLHDTLGADFVTLFDNESEVQALVSNRDWIAAKRASRPARIAAVVRSKYGIPSLTRALATLTEAGG